MYREKLRLPMYELSLIMSYLMSKRIYCVQGKLDIFNINLIINRKSCIKFLDLSSDQNSTARGVKKNLLEIGECEKGMSDRLIIWIHLVK